MTSVTTKLSASALRPKQFDLVCQYAMTHVVEGTLIISAFKVDGNQTSHIKPGMLMVRTSIKDSTGDWEGKGSHVCTEIREGAIGSGHRMYIFTCSDQLEITEKQTFRNLPYRDHVDVQYLKAAERILVEGAHSGNRTNTPATKLFGHMMTFDLREGYPLLSSKYMDPTNIFKELGWICRGETNVNQLGCGIWDDWATPEGELGPVYGAQWRAWEDIRIVDTNEAQNVEDFLISQGYECLNSLGDSGKFVYKKQYDQIADIVDSLKNNPNDRRMLVTALNPGVTPVTQVPYENQRDRREDYLNIEIEKVMADKNWMAEAERRMDAGGEAPIMQARDYCEGILHNCGPSDLDTEFMDEEEILEALLDHVGAPKIRYFSPSENAAVGQQALPPCHMIFQLGTSPMELSDRIDTWRWNEVWRMLKEAADNPDQYPEGTDLSPGNSALCAKFYEKASRTLSDLYSALDDKSVQMEKITQFLNEQNVAEYFLDMTMYQRSADWFLGVPYNIASYSALLMAFAKVAGMQYRNFFHMFGDYHIYDNHREQILEQMSNEIHDMPRLIVDPGLERIEDITADTFQLVGYKTGPKLKGKVAV